MPPDLATLLKHLARSGCPVLRNPLRDERSCGCFGGTTTGWVDDEGNGALVFASSNEPNALKGVAITFGARTSAAERDNIKQGAMTYLAEHLGDREIAPGVWIRPLFDTKA